MGEKNAKRESTLGGFHKKEADLMKDVCLSSLANFVRLHRLDADKLKYVHSKAFEYDRRSFSPTLEAALIVERINGERTYV